MVRRRCSACGQLFQIYTQQSENGAVFDPRRVPTKCPECYRQKKQGVKAQEELLEIKANKLLRFVNKEWR